MKVLSSSVKLIIVFSIPIILFNIPYNALPTNTSICFFKYFLGITCPGCGITRAFLSVLHFEFIKAINLNFSIIIIFPIFSYYWFRYIIKITLLLLEDFSCHSKLKIQ